MSDLQRLLADGDVETGSAEFRLDDRAFDRVAARIARGGDRWVRAVAYAEDGRVVLVRNRWSDGWVLPGGTVEPGEGLRAALVREVTEETGLDVTVEDPLAVETQTFVCGDRTATGHCVVYAARAETTALHPDPGVDGDEIRAVEWFSEVPASLESAVDVGAVLADRT